MRNKKHILITASTFVILGIILAVLYFGRNENEAYDNEDSLATNEPANRMNTTNTSNKQTIMNMHLLLDGFYFPESDTTQRSTVRLHREWGVTYLFLPYWAQNSAIYVHFNNSDVFLDGSQIASGEATQVFSLDRPVVLNINGIASTVIPMFGSKIPTIFITTESGSLDYIHEERGNRERVNFLFVDEFGYFHHAGGGDMNGRGNYSWLQPKRPYNFRLASGTSLPLFGMGEGRHWTLLAEFLDDLRVRNTLSLNLARELGLAHTSQIRPVDVFINNEYAGIYTLVERRNINHAVNITDLQEATAAVNTANLNTFPHAGIHEAIPGTIKYFDIPVNPSDITGGYLMEIQLSHRYMREDSGFVTNRGMPINLAAPGIASRAQVEYISSLFQQAEDAIYSETGYNNEGVHFSELIDVESFALMYIFSEFLMDVDTAVTSFFMHKESDLVGSGKIYAGPPWDYNFTLATLGPALGTDFRNPFLWWANDRPIDHDFDKEPHILSALYQHEFFREYVTRLWQDKAAPAIRVLIGFDESTSSLRSIDEYIAEVYASRYMERIIWPIPSGGRYSNQSIPLMHFARARFLFLEYHWGT